MPDAIDLSKEELDALHDRIKHKKLTEEDYHIFRKVLQFAMWVPIQLQNAKITIRNFKAMIFGQKTEKNKHSKNKNNSNLKDPVDPKADEVIPDRETPEGKPANQNNISVPQNDLLLGLDKPKKGHGRKPATDYIPDEVIVVVHEKLKSGNLCPTDCGGRVYSIPVTPGGTIRIKGQSCGHIISYKFHNLRCALCGKTFTPPAPEGFQKEKYDERFKAIIVVQK